MSEDDSKKEDTDEELSSVSSEDSAYDFPESPKTKVLVTGANGYLGTHIVQMLLEKGVTVKATVRDIGQAGVLMDMKVVYEGRLEIFEIRVEEFITKWKELVRGCVGVIHTASPNPFDSVKYQVDLIFPAVEGTINILQAALEEGVKKVVLTGCICSIRGGEYKQNFTADDWADPDKITHIERSKLLAERTAWAFIRENSNKFGMTVILPGFLIGPSLQKHYTSSSAQVIKRIANGQVESFLKLHLSTCDVRNAAEAHIAALWSKKSNFKRYICVENSHWFEDIPKEILEKYKPDGIKISTATTPKWHIMITRLYDPSIRSIVPFLGEECYFSNTAIIDDLQVDFRSFSTSLEDMLADMIAKGELKHLKEIGEGQDCRPTSMTLTKQKTELDRKTELDNKKPEEGNIFTKLYAIWKA